MSKPLTDEQIWGEPQKAMDEKPAHPHKCPIRDCVCQYWFEGECLADECVLD